MLVSFGLIELGVFEGADEAIEDDPLGVADRFDGDLLDGPPYTSGSLDGDPSGDTR